MFPASSAPRKARNIAVAVVVPPHPAFTRPYFSRPSVEQSYYNIDDPRYLNLPTSYYPLSAKLTFHYHGVDFHATAVVQSVHRVTGPGPMLEPLLVGPPISLWLSPPAGIVPLTSATLHLQVTLHSDVEGPAKGTIHLELPRAGPQTRLPPTSPRRRTEMSKMSPLRFIPRVSAPSNTASRRWPSTTARSIPKASKPLDIPACARIPTIATRTITRRAWM